MTTLFAFFSSTVNYCVRLQTAKISYRESCHQTQMLIYHTLFNIKRRDKQTDRQTKKGQKQRNNLNPKHPYMFMAKSSKAYRVFKEQVISFYPYADQSSVNQNAQVVFTEL